MKVHIIEKFNGEQGWVGFEEERGISTSGAESRSTEDGGESSLPGRVPGERTGFRFGGHRWPRGNPTAPATNHRPQSHHLAERASRLEVNQPTLTLQPTKAIILSMESTPGGHGARSTRLPSPPQATAGTPARAAFTHRSLRRGHSAAAGPPLSRATKLPVAHRLPPARTPVPLRPLPD